MPQSPGHPTIRRSGDAAGAEPGFEPTATQSLAVGHEVPTNNASRGTRTACHCLPPSRVTRAPRTSLPTMRATQFRAEGQEASRANPRLDGTFSLFHVAPLLVASDILGGLIRDYEFGARPGPLTSPCHPGRRLPRSGSERREAQRDPVGGGVRHRSYGASLGRVRLAPAQPESDCRTL